MGFSKNYFFNIGLAWLAIFSSTHAHEQNTTVIFEITTIIKTDVDGRKKALVKKMQETVRKSYSTMALWKSIRTAFDVPFMCNEQEVRTEFFKFLDGIPVQIQCPHIISDDGFTMPPIMVAWLLGKLDTQQVQQQADKYIDAQECSESNKKFYHAMIYTTFNPEVSHKTRIVNNKTEKLVDFCRNNGCKIYLVGHCDPSMSKWLATQHTDLFSKFDKVFFSYQDSATAATVFDDSWWLNHLGLDKQKKYLFVSDWTHDGKKVDKPLHYTSNSKTLMHIIA